MSKRKKATASKNANSKPAPDLWLLDLWPLVKAGGKSCILLRIDPPSQKPTTASTACKNSLSWTQQRLLKLTHRSSANPCKSCLKHPLGQMLQGHELSSQQAKSVPIHHKTFYGLTRIGTKFQAQPRRPSANPRGFNYHPHDMHIDL